MQAAPQQAAPQMMGAPQQQFGMVQQFVLPPPGTDIFGAGPVHIKQKIDLEELLAEMVGLCYEKQNQYDVEGAVGGPMFIHESSGCVQRALCRTHRQAEFFLRYGNNKNGPVIARIFKPFHIGGPSDCCCRINAEVYDQDDKLFRKMTDSCLAENFCQTKMFLKRPDDTLVGHVHACLCQLGICCPCCASVEFPIKGPEMQETEGKIIKHFGGFKECFNGANNFELIFPADATLEDKLTYVTANILIDFLHFEKES